MIRLAYHEDLSYVTFLGSAYDRWEEIESEYGEPLIRKTGSVSAGASSQELFRGAIEACEQQSFPHETLSGDELWERFAEFDVSANFEAAYQPYGGYVHSERGITAHIERAHAYSAEIPGRERVSDWQSTMASA